MRCQQEQCGSEMTRTLKTVRITKEAEGGDKLHDNGRSEVTYTVPERVVWLCPKCGSEVREMLD
jgi:hypothetical protein